jgi:hypothetical protein
MEWIKARARHTYHIAIRPIWYWLFVFGIGGLLGVYQGIISLVLPPDQREPYDVWNILPHWSWGWWVTVIAIVVGIAIIEGSYRLHRETSKKVEAIEPKIDLLFDQTLNKCKNLEPTGIFVHVLVFNQSLVPINCEAILANVEKKCGDVYVPTEYKSQMHLSWAAVYDWSPEKYSKTDLSPGKEAHSIDIFGAEIINGVPQIRLTVPSPHLSCRIVTRGIYRLTVKVSPRGAKHKEIPLIVDWRGDVRNINVSRE